MEKPTILIVEDEFIVAMDLQAHLEALGYSVSGSVNSGENSIQHVQKTGVDLVLMDIILTGKMDGIEAASQIRSRFHIPVIYITANTNPRIFEQARVTEPFGFIIKPFSEQELQANIEMALYKHRMEEKLRRNEEKYRQVVENANEGITVAQDGMLKYFNPKILEIAERSQAELASRPFSDFLPPEDRDVMMERHHKRLQGEPIPDVYSFKILHKDGRIKWLEVRAVAIEWEGKPAALTFLSDISERKQAEEELNTYKNHLEELVEERTAELQQEIAERKRLESQLVQSQKIDAIGQLAGGLAHDLNSLLGIILGHGDLMRDDLPENDFLRDSLEEIIEAGYRAKTLVRQLLDFARPSKNNRHQIQLAPIVDDVSRLLCSSLPKTISIRQRIEAGSSVVLANSTQIAQVIMNLGMNAGHAIGEREGKIEIALENVDIDAALADLKGGRQGRYIRLSISDTGGGMSHDVQEHMFEPFFTTKGVDKGSGLGLSIVHGIVKSHGGFVTAASEPGIGSTFQVYLPTIE
ncbi:MAG: PAS domain S-box protein [bacterium]|nr:PAS domain S-box protein [bacterium]